jgi:hypothetical protein
VPIGEFCTHAHNWEGAVPQVTPQKQTHLQQMWAPGRHLGPLLPLLLVLLKVLVCRLGTDYVWLASQRPGSVLLLPLLPGAAATEYPAASTTPLVTINSSPQWRTYATCLAFVQRHCLEQRLRSPQQMSNFKDKLVVRGCEPFCFTTLE